MWGDAGVTSGQGRRLAMRGTEGAHTAHPRAMRESLFGFMWPGQGVTGRPLIRPSATFSLKGRRR